MSKILIKCDGICCDNSIEINLPKDWHYRLKGNCDMGGESSYLFCSDCEEQGKWFESVCPGCVSDFSDCSFGKSFMYSDVHIMKEQLLIISQGKCPFRGGGTFCLDDKGFNSIDISSVASNKSGEAIVAGLRKYFKKYKDVLKFDNDLE